MRRVLQWTAAAVVSALALLPGETHAALKCRQPNYITRDGKIFAQDPKSPGTENELTIRGVVWSGMEKDNMIPDGLWGADSKSSRGVIGTKISNVLGFLSNNSINSVRLPLNADYINANPFPQLAYIHQYDNREITTWADPNTVKYFDLLGRLIETLQTNSISVLLDIHLLTMYPKDAYWYTNPYVNVTQSPLYTALSYLAKSYCNATYWNVLGVDLKDEMTDVQWNANTADANIKTDWRGAAQVLANRVLELCPSWLVFIGGASSATAAQTFSVGKGYEPSKHWDGGNLHNATKNPLAISVPNKIVYSPHAHTHGKIPQNYFYSADSNCTGVNPTDTYGFEGAQLTSSCVDYINGNATKSKYPCSPSTFGCAQYKHLSTDAIKSTYSTVMNEALADVLLEGKVPVILGSFSGVYGSAFQPHQTAALDFLVNYAATSLRGGYFWSLNPDTEYYLEDSTSPGSGLFGKTHFGVFSPTSWQQPNADLVAALKKLPSTPIPCYGGKAYSPGGGTSAVHEGRIQTARLAVVFSALVAATMTMW